ncbi:MAG: hypothetical protein AB7G17_00640 [Phycisphaerales bacterium]
MSRRAFVLPMVILTALVASLVVGVAMQRHAAQELLARRQVEEYRRHHDMLGAQAIIRFWLSRKQNPELAELARQKTPVHKFSLPGGLRITVWLEDGQGLVKADLTEVFPQEKREWFGAVLARMPQGRGDLVRRVGPVEISLNAAPREVLAALRADDASFAELVIGARDRERLTQASMTQLLERSGFTATEIGDVARLVTYDTTLWRLRVEAEEVDRSIRTFTALVETRAGAMGVNMPSLHEWREETPHERASLVESARMRTRSTGTRVGAGR